MRRPAAAGAAVDAAVLLYLLAVLGLSRVSSIKVSTPAELSAAKGDTVTLPCTFTSKNTPTSKLSVSWSYTPQSKGPTQSFFYFSSKAFPPTRGQFAGRIKWIGRPALWDASISLINATLKDNGTYECQVTNPPDVDDSPNSHIELTVTPKVSSIRFSDVAVLVAFVLVPSGLITFFLIGRMFCPRKQQNQPKAYRSPIEVTEGEEYKNYPPPPDMRSNTCCGLYLTDSEDEAEYYGVKKRHSIHEYAESQC